MRVASPWNSAAPPTSNITPTAWSAPSTSLHHNLPGMDGLLSGRSILVVEDEMLVLLSVQDMLVDLGCISVRQRSSFSRMFPKVGDLQCFIHPILSKSRLSY
jgi:hypothetical protein